MKNFLSLILIIYFLTLPALSNVFEGLVEKETIVLKNKIIDYETNLPITNAKITLPQSGFSTYTNNNGEFSNLPKLTGQTILSVEKDGYKPFSMTVNERIAMRPMVIGVEKTKLTDITISDEMMHLGDGNFSNQSANSYEFRVKPVGPFFTKKFFVGSVSGECFFVIGSVIGLDTLMAKRMGQNKIVNAYSSPAEIYFNGIKIGQLELNGDNKRFNLPNNLVRKNAYNEVTIRTGRNLQQSAYVDYDDIEIMNLRFESGG